MWDYTKTVVDHFLHPHNVGEVENPDGYGEVGSVACGDALRLTFKLDEQGKIKEAKFKTFGCASAIASSSVLTDLIIGKTPKEALKVTNKEIATELGGLPEEKMHCSVMGREALEAAIANMNGEEYKEHDFEDTSELICECFNVTENQIRKAVKENNLITIEQVTNFTKAGGACQSCHDDISRIIKEVQAESQIVNINVPINYLDKEGKPIKQKSKKDDTENKKPELSPYQMIRQIEQVVELELRPHLRQDGGDVEIVDIRGKTVFVRLSGMCQGCGISNYTIMLFQETLRDKVDKEIAVEEVL